MAETPDRIVLDVTEDFPGGWPRAGDVIVIHPDSERWPISICRYPGGSFFPELERNADRLKARGPLNTSQRNHLKLVK